MLTETRIGLDGRQRTINKVDMAVQRIRETYATYARSPQLGGGLPLWVSYSGGKDSTVILELVKRAGVPYEAHYSITTVDPPELVEFIKAQPDVIRQHARRRDGSPITMWNLIPYKGHPPTRVYRYCCADLKEASGRGRITVTGVRWAESARRKNGWGGLNFSGKRAKAFADQAGAVYQDHSRGRNTRFHMNFADTPGELFLNNDNDVIRRLTEHCVPKGKVVLNPIIDWSDADVWEFIRTENLPYCCLYDEGKSRLGCIACPMSSAAARQHDLDRWPKYREAYMRAFDRMLKSRPSRHSLKGELWETAQDVMDWWLDSTPRPAPDDGQISFF